MGKAGSVGFEIRRKLKEKRSEFVCRFGHTYGVVELSHCIVAIHQALSVLDLLWRFERKPEARRHCIHPALNRFLSRKAPESLIHFDGLKL